MAYVFTKIGLLVNSGAILGACSLRTSSTELILAAVVIVFTIFVFRDCISSVSPSVELEAESEIDDEMEEPVAGVDEHDFPREVAKVVVVWQPNEDLERKDTSHESDVPFSIPGFEQTSHKATVHKVSERYHNDRNPILDDIEEVADSPEVLIAVFFDTIGISGSLRANPRVDDEHWSNGANEGKNTECGV